MTCRYISHFVVIVVFFSFVKNYLLTILMNKSKVRDITVLVSAPTDNSRDSLAIQLGVYKFFSCITMSSVEHWRLHAVVKNKLDRCEAVPWPALGAYRSQTQRFWRFQVPIKVVGVIGAGLDEVWNFPEHHSLIHLNLLRAARAVVGTLDGVLRPNELVLKLQELLVDRLVLALYLSLPIMPVVFKFYLHLCLSTLERLDIVIQDAPQAPHQIIWCVEFDRERFAKVFNLPHDLIHRIQSERFQLAQVFESPLCCLFDDRAHSST